MMPVMFVMLIMYIIQIMNCLQLFLLMLLSRFIQVISHWTMLNSRSLIHTN